jgi:hypothetical protein
VWSRQVDTSRELAYQLDTTVDVGSIVDFAIQPNGSDCNDHARFSATITTVADRSITSLTVAAPQTVLAPTEKMQLTATATLADGTSQDQTAASSWTTSNPTVASVSHSGLVQTIALGTADISASFGGVRGTVSIRVDQLTLAVRGPLVISRGQEVQLTAISTSSDGSTRDVTQSVQWMSAHPLVAPISSGGLLAGRGQGSAEIQATHGSVTGHLTIRVEAPRLDIIGQANLRPGETSQLTVIAIHPDGSRADRTTSAEWRTTAPGVATVTTSGIVSALASGRADIEARYEGGIATFAVIISLPTTRVIIDAPTTNPSSLTVHFAWRLIDADPARSYRFQTRLDLGVNACDGGIEESFEAGDASNLTVTLDPRRYQGRSVDFAVQVLDDRGFRVCQQGRRFTLP